jgi:hypothetical protein
MLPLELSFIKKRGMGCKKRERENNRVKSSSVQKESEKKKSSHALSKRS